LIVGSYRCLLTKAKVIHLVLIPSTTVFIFFYHCLFLRLDIIETRRGFHTVLWYNRLILFHYLQLIFLNIKLKINPIHFIKSNLKSPLFFCSFQWSFLWGVSNSFFWLPKVWTFFLLSEAPSFLRTWRRVCDDSNILRKAFSVSLIVLSNSYLVVYFFYSDSLMF